jgi:hypothetical protein
MAAYRIDNKNIKVLGASIKAFIDGLGFYKEVGLQILQKHGIVDPQSDQWYSLQANLDAYRELEMTVGNSTLFVIGEKIPKNAGFPAEIDSIEKALASIDIAYHMNHSLDGKVMFDPATGQMTEGIGHYHFEKTGENQARITCDNPYPTYFDEGIIFAIAQRFKEASFVRLEEGPITRSQGGDKDVYLIQWF